MIAQGAWEANQKLHDSGWPQVGRLILVEFYLDRASDAWRALQVQATATPNQLKVVGFVKSGAGALRRSLDSSYRGAAYDFISASTGAPLERRADDHLHARHQARAHRSARAADAGAAWSRSSSPRRRTTPTGDAQIGRTLFDLLVPVEMEPFLGGTTEMVIELDSGTAALPWELLDTVVGRDLGQRPAAVGDPQQAAAEAAHERVPRPAVGRQRRRQHPRHRRADARRLDVPAAAGRARRGDRRRDAADRRARRRRGRARARADERQRRRAQHHQRAVRAAVPHRPRRRPRRAGAPTAASCCPAAPTSARPR